MGTSSGSASKARGRNVRQRRQPVDEHRKKVADLILKKGFPIARIGTMLGRSPGYIHEYLYKGSPKALRDEDRHRLAKILEIDADDLLANAPARRGAHSSGRADDSSAVDEAADTPPPSSVEGREPPELRADTPEMEHGPVRCLGLTVPAMVLIDIKAWRWRTAAEVLDVQIPGLDLLPSGYAFADSRGLPPLPGTRNIFPYALIVWERTRLGLPAGAALYADRAYPPKPGDLAVLRLRSVSAKQPSPHAVVRVLAMPEPEVPGGALVAGLDTDPEAPFPEEPLPPLDSSQWSLDRVTGIVF